MKHYDDHFNRRTWYGPTREHDKLNDLFGAYNTANGRDMGQLI